MTAQSAISAANPPLSSSSRESVSSQIDTPASCSLGRRFMPRLSAGGLGEVLERHVGVGEAPVVDGHASRMSRWIGSVTSQTLTFMPATTRSPASQKAMNSRVAGSPRKTTRSQVRREAGVLHADVVLVGEEVRQAVVGSPGPSMSRAARAPGAARWPSARPQPRGVERVLARGDVAGGEHAGSAGLQVLVDEDAVVDVDPGLLGEPRCAAARRCRRPRSRSRARARRWCGPAPRRRRPRTPRRRSRGASARRGRGGCRGRSRRPRGPARARAGRERVDHRHVEARWRADAATSAPIQPPPTTTTSRLGRAARAARRSRDAAEVEHAVEVGAGDRETARLGAGGEQQPVVAQPLPSSSATCPPRVELHRRTAQTQLDVLLGVEARRRARRPSRARPRRAGSPSRAAAARRDALALGADEHHAAVEALVAQRLRGLGAGQPTCWSASSRRGSRPPHPFPFPRRGAARRDRASPGRGVRVPPARSPTPCRSRPRGELGVGGPRAPGSGGGREGGGARGGGRGERAGSSHSRWWCPARPPPPSPSPHAPRGGGAPPLPPAGERGVEGDSNPRPPGCDPGALPTEL